MRGFNNCRSNGVFKRDHYDKILKDIKETQNGLDTFIPKIRYELNGWCVVKISSNLFRDSKYQFAGKKEYETDIYGIFTTLRECKLHIEMELTYI